MLVLCLYLCTRRRSNSAKSEFAAITYIRSELFISMSEEAAVSVLTLFSVFEKIAHFGSV